MELTLVVAASENNVIGKGNQLPWHLSDDLKFFKQVTSGKPVVMGRKTFESLGRPLPNRLNIVLSRSAISLPEGVLLFHALQEALEYLRQQALPEACIIGGGIVFEEALPVATQVYLTRVHTTIADGEAFFPELSPDQWQLTWESAHPADEKHAYAFTFQQYKRI
jgi:dihydrofolate reductase